MTLPDERYRAVRNARAFLRSLLDPKKTPKVPKDIREEAYWVLKHFPTELDMNQCLCDMNEVFAKPEEEDENE